MREQFQDKDFSVDELHSYFTAKYPEAKADLYDGLFKDLQSLDISEDVGEAVLTQINRRKALLKLSETAYKASQGLCDISEVETLSQQMSLTPAVKGFESEDTDLEVVLRSAVVDEGLRWRLDFLNKSLGSLRPGDFGFIFKRPETGGTAFCASEVGYMLDQTNKPIIWVNNEESNDKVILRIYQSYFGATLDQIRANSRLYREQFIERTKGKLKFFGLDRSNKRDLEGIVKQYGPALVVVDQLDKVTGFENDRDDLRLGAIYQWFRELCKLGFAGIGVTQADGSAENVKWLNMSHVANAKTSKQAEADWVMGIGKTNDEASEYVRYLTICKNKLLGSTDSIPELRHGRAEILIEPEIMRFKDIMKFE